MVLRPLYVLRFAICDSSCHLVLMFDFTVTLSHSPSVMSRRLDEAVNLVMDLDPRSETDRLKDLLSELYAEIGAERNRAAILAEACNSPRRAATLATEFDLERQEGKLRLAALMFQYRNSDKAMLRPRDVRWNGVHVHTRPRPNT